MIIERIDTTTLPNNNADGRPIYALPSMTSYSDESLLELLGPARTLYACDPNNPCL